MSSSAIVPFSNSADSKPESLEAHNIKTAFFTHATLTEIGRRLVSHYFLLTEEELAMWEEDPESFGMLVVHVEMNGRKHPSSIQKCNFSMQPSI